ncbi:keratin-associated protein 16-1-like [Hyposmocoma kahamanoa]|uniref:keratin-associated protein 16-1-like n=1 Tax=Hyposmocoma kahamanoa TaxID=1477025 RepID=UPI000E6D649D|nr:keratin-associated protein 16-1-like [Hyposmocoma kahamanoa]
MGAYVFLLLALISTAFAAPTPQCGSLNDSPCGPQCGSQWKCYRTNEGATVCIGQPGCPSSGQPCVNYGQNCQPPTSCSATIYTPSNCNPCNPCSTPPPCAPAPCTAPCAQPDPCTCYK